MVPPAPVLLMREAAHLDTSLSPSAIRAAPQIVSYHKNHLFQPTASARTISPGRRGRYAILPVRDFIRLHRLNRNSAMMLLRRLFLALTICSVVCLAAPTHQLGGLAIAQTTTQPMRAPAQVRVDLFRGLADIFSRGMDTLTEKLNRQAQSTRL